MNGGSAWRGGEAGEKDLVLSLPASTRRKKSFWKGRSRRLRRYRRFVGWRGKKRRLAAVAGGEREMEEEEDEGRFDRFPPLEFSTAQFKIIVSE